MADRTDRLIEATVACREAGMTFADVRSVVSDVYHAPWDQQEKIDFARRVVACVFDRPKRRA
jgi:hypothetical protein